MNKIIKTILVFTAIFSIDVHAREPEIKFPNTISQVIKKIRTSLNRKSVGLSQYIDKEYDYSNFIQNKEIANKLNKEISDALRQCKNVKTIQKYENLISKFLELNANRMLVVGASLTELLECYFREMNDFELKKEIALNILKYNIFKIFYKKLDEFILKYNISNRGSVSDFCNMIIDNVINENVPDIQVCKIAHVNDITAFIAKIMTLYRNFAIMASNVVNEKKIVVLDSKIIPLNTFSVLNISDKDLVQKIIGLLKEKLPEEGRYNKSKLNEYLENNGIKLLQEKVLDEAKKHQQKVAQEYKKKNN